MRSCLDGRTLRYSCSSIYDRMLRISRTGQLARNRRRAFREPPGPGALQSDDHAAPARFRSAHHDLPATFPRRSGRPADSEVSQEVLQAIPRARPRRQGAALSGPGRLDRRPLPIGQPSAERPLRRPARALRLHSIGRPGPACARRARSRRSHAIPTLRSRDPRGRYRAELVGRPRAQREG
jgi:hypothetical protein